MFLDGLPVEARELLLGVAEPVSFVRGSMLFRHGEAADGAYIVRDGVAKATIIAPGGDPFEVGFFSAGDLLGELALVASGMRSATVTAETLLDGWHVTRGDFQALVAQRGPAALALQRALVMSLAHRLVGVASRASRLEAKDDIPSLHATAASETGAPSPLRRPPFDVSVFLPKLPFFEGFSLAEIDEAASLGRYVDVARGAPLIKPGSPAGPVWLVVRGAAEMLRPVANGLRRVAVLGPGQPLGLPSHLLDVPHGSWVLARESSLLLEWPAEAFGRLLASDTAAGNRLRRSAQRYLAAAIERANREVARLATRAPAPA